MVNSRLPYERDPIPEDKKPLRFEPETVVTKLSFGFSVGLGLFFLALVAIGIWRSLNQFLNYLSGLF